MKEYSPKVGDLISITKRLCSASVQKYVLVGQKCYVHEVTSSPTGIQVLVVNHPYTKGKTIHLNSSCFTWQVENPSVGNLKSREELFKEKVHNDTQTMIEKLTFKEQMFVSFLPLIITEFIWHYTDSVVKQATDNRIEILKKLSRVVKDLRKEYYSMVKKDLDVKHINHFMEETKNFLNEYQKDFTILWFTVNKEFKRIMPNHPYVELRTDAIIAMLMIRFLDEHNQRADKVLSKALGTKEAASVRIPLMRKLYDCLDAYAGEIEQFNFDDKDIATSTKILKKKLEAIEFCIE